MTWRGLHSTGDIGYVWFAHDKVLDREIALKEIKADQSGSEINRQRLFVKGHTFTMAIPEYHDWIREYARSGVSSRLVQLLNQSVSVCNTVVFVHSRQRIRHGLTTENVVVGDLSEVLVMDWD